MINITKSRKLRLRRGECLVVATKRDGSCEIHPAVRKIDDGPTVLREGLAVTLDRSTAYDSERFGTVYFVSAEEGRSIRYQGDDSWDGPSASRVGRAMMDVRAKDVARVEPEGLFGFLTKAMPVMILVILLAMIWMVIQGVAAA